MIISCFANPALGHMLPGCCSRLAAVDKWQANILCIMKPATDWTCHVMRGILLYARVHIVTNAATHFAVLRVQQVLTFQT